MRPKFPLPVKGVIIPCIHEGPVISPCPNCKNGKRDIRSCNHPAPTTDRDTCTRVYVSPEHQPCQTCADRAVS